MSCFIRTGLLVCNNVLMKTQVNGYEIKLIQHALVLMYIIIHGVRKCLECVCNL